MKVLKIYNSMSHEKEEFIPLMIEGKKDFVGIYSCGPTIYGDPHIGNIRAFTFAGVLGNLIRNILGLPVVHVMNMTDVGHLVSDADDGEDKMEKGSRNENISAWDIAKKYEENFKKYLKLMNLRFDHHPRATDYIKEQIDIVLELEKGGYTYVIDGDGVYMDTSKITDYGKLLGPNYKKHLEGLDAGSRVTIRGKKNVTDFALWKFSPKDQKRQMEWDSPWGIGFPGWHIECSAMSRKFLGDNFDIHTGGYDHIPVHHTDEIAQSECSYSKDKPWVKYWMHNQFLNIQGDKLSKSKGNFVTLSDLLERGFSALDLKFMFLNSHYRSFLEFNYVNLESSKNARNNLIRKLAREYKKVEDKFGNDIVDNSKIKNFTQFDNQKITTSLGQEIFASIIDSLFDDINTIDVFSIINKSFENYSTYEELIDILNIIFYLDEKLFGLDIYKDMIFLLNKQDIQAPLDIIELANKRDQSRKQKDFQKADEYRLEIEKRGYLVKDTKDGYEIITK